MKVSAKPAAVEDILPWRDLHRHEMNCQIVHDSLHSRKGWTQSFLLMADEIVAGYGAIAIAGPWKGKPTIFEFYIAPGHRLKAFEFFEAFLTASGAVAMEVQTNGPLLPVMLHTYARDIVSEKIIFRDGVTTTHAPAGAVFRRAIPEDAAQVQARELDPDAKWVVALAGEVVAAGDVLYHYNRPYGDVYMKVAEPFRRRGLGAFLVQELKRVCYGGGNIPAARCNPENVASRTTLQRAGFVPCGHILIGSLPR